jgi:hypothetical protein
MQTQTQTRRELESIVNAAEIEALFVQSAGGMAYSNGVLTLSQLAPTTLFFSDRPDRVAGHVPSEEFVASWDKGPDSFSKDPPNAVLSIFDGDEVDEVVLVLREPLLAVGHLVYKVDILDGEIPAKGGPSALFIDVIGRPMSQISMAGMRRREGRRMARRVSRR